MDQRGHLHENEFLTILKFRNKCYEQLEWEKQMKKWGHLSSFYVPLLIYGP